MVLYDGAYQWDGTKKGNYEPIAWFGGSYHLLIFCCSPPSDKILALKSHLCLFAGTGEGQSISANPEKFAKRICADFSLNIERVLWVEDHLTGDDRYEIVHFTSISRLGQTVFYRVGKRPPRSPELHLINQALSALPPSSFVVPRTPPC